MGGRSLSPIVRRELENLDKDADSRKLAMKALKLYVKDLDSKAIPLFLAQVSETKETGNASGEYTISLYEVLARVHGPKIVPQIDNIMTTIVKTLTSSAGSFALHQACSKVVPAIARYGMDPTTPEDKKRHIIHSLCKPLSDCLLGSHEVLSSGAALCLKALVECDNWRYASNDMVNEVCQRVAAALDKHLQTNLHMALVMSLARHNSSIVDAYARLLVRSGLHILNEDLNSQKRLTAIHMVNCLMKCLDPKSISSELESVMKAMENCQSDQMAYVRGAAFEALQAARKICTERGSKIDRDHTVSITGSNYDRTGNMRRRHMWGSGDVSPLIASPESQTVDSFVGHDSYFDSPLSTNQAASPKLAYDRRNVNRKLWSTCENGCALNISLKDGIFSEATRGWVSENSEHNEFSGNCGDYENGFKGFLHDSARFRVSRSTTPSPQRSSRSLINVDNVKIFSTPRKLIRSLQENEESSDSLGEQANRRFRSPSSQYERTPTSKYVPNGSTHLVENHATDGTVNPKGNVNSTSSRSENFVQGSSESVSSTDNGSPEVAVTNNILQTYSSKLVDQNQKWKKLTSNTVGIGIAFAVILAAMLCFLFDDQGESPNLIPT
ncbi:OLC1v1038298C1 [Oldenlandia corymbosa var. corymbosa]|uniref:OLC1v1038298C1 n=1 Tax=Oldenlandia corymbosa var. corymbosa TaxID=529605 RepID=A0AAV1D0X5_OLDCO|nr:OLC1v1038298C1 [Oldenlandia corymbosa var. corymbosa]